MDKILCDREYCCAAGVTWKRRGELTGVRSELNYIAENCETTKFKTCPHYNFPRTNDTKIILITERAKQVTARMLAIRQNAKITK